MVWQGLDAEPEQGRISDRHIERGPLGQIRQVFSGRSGARKCLPGEALARRRSTRTASCVAHMEVVSPEATPGGKAIPGCSEAARLGPAVAWAGARA